MDSKILDLREKWRVAVRTRHAALAAKACAERMASQYDEDLAMLEAEMLVPPGYAVDVLGDGTIKPADQCARFIKE